MRRWKRVAALTALPLGLIWLCTGGCVVHRYWLLPSDINDKEFRPYVKGEVTSRAASYGVPLIFQYHTDQPPFGIRVTYITHTVLGHPTITFDSVTIKFPDGAVLDLTDLFREG